MTRPNTISLSAIQSFARTISPSPRHQQRTVISVRFRIAHDICHPEDPDMPEDNSSLFAMGRQQVTRICTKNVTIQTDIRTSLVDDLRSPSGIFIIAKKKRRKNTTSLQSNALLRYCPRRRRMTDSTRSNPRHHPGHKNCFCFSDIPASRISRQVVGLHIPKSWLADFDRESQDLDGLDHI